MADRDGLTPSERAIIDVLRSEGREMSNDQLKQQSGHALTGRSREKLNERGLVKSRKVGRGLVHELDGDGWDRFQERLRLEEAQAPVAARAQRAGKDDLTSEEAAILVVLLAEAREIGNKELA